MKKIARGLNWEAKRNKYDRIRALVIENYPKVGDSEKYSNYDFVEAVITKERVSVKLKKIKTQFKKAVDCGKKSGGGRIGFTFYTICQNIWGNSPAVTAIGNSVDSSYSGNGSSSMLHEVANSSAQLGGQDDFKNQTLKQHLRILRRTKLIQAQHQSKLQVTANKLENFSETVVIKSSLHVYILTRNCFSVLRKTSISKGK